MSTRVHLAFQRVRLLRHTPYFSLDLRPGVHGVVVPQEKRADAFVRAAAGISPPTHGHIRFGNEQPGSSPKLRAKIGSLLPVEPELPGFSSVQDYLAHVLSIRRQQGVPFEGEPGEIPFVGPLLKEPTQGLPPPLRRRIALGLALVIQEPAFLVLHDPLRGMGEEVADLALKTLSERAASGAIVVCLTPTRRSAEQLADHIHIIETLPTSGAKHARYLLRTERPREVASRLANQPTVVTTQIRHDQELFIEVESEDVGAEVITETLAATQVEVFEVRRVMTPTTDGGS